MSSEIAIRVDGVSKRFPLPAGAGAVAKRLLAAQSEPRDAHLWALKDVSFRVFKGETLGIIGRNGAGKTTLLRVISQITEPTSGSVSVYGSVALVLALQSGFNVEFTGRENIYLKCAIMGLTREETDQRIEDIIEFANIDEFIDRPLKTYSQGMRARLAFAVAIHVNPETLVIDETLAVGDDTFRRKCISRLAALKKKGCTILFVSHASPVILQLCDRAILLDKGELLIAGDPKLVVSSYQRFVYSPLEERPKVRADLLALATNSRAATSDDMAGSAERKAKDTPAGPPEPDFDPALTPQSTSRSLPQGAQILETTILDQKGKRVNLLTPRRTYKLAVSMVFPQPAGRVRFGMTIKTVEGLEISGTVSHLTKKGAGYVEAGTRILVTFPFAAKLAPGTYFVDVSVRGDVEGRDIELHRILDAEAFHVGVDEDCPITGLADLSVAPHCHCKIVPPPYQPRDRGADDNASASLDGRDTRQTQIVGE